MSTQTSAPLKFFIYAPYSSDPEMPARRAKARPTHLANMQGFRENGILKVGAPLSTTDSIDLAVADKKLLGSGIIMEVASLEEVKTIIEGDVYWKENIWDREKMVIGHMFA